MDLADGLRLQLFSCIFVKASEAARLRDVALVTVKTGMGGRYGNKGAILSRKSWSLARSVPHSLTSHLPQASSSTTLRSASSIAISQLVRRTDASGTVTSSTSSKTSRPSRSSALRRLAPMRPAALAPWCLITS